MAPNDRTQAQPPSRGVDCRTKLEHAFASPMPHTGAGWLLPEVNGWPASKQVNEIVYAQIDLP
jgi:hypothetical protein